MQLQGNIVKIKPDLLAKRTKGGLLIPATAKEQPQTGTIVDCGPACLDAKKDARVIFPRKNASIYIENDVEYYLIPETRITYIAADGERIESK